MNKVNIYNDWKSKHYKLISLLKNPEKSILDLNLIKELINKNYLTKFDNYYSFFENLDYHIDGSFNSINISEEDNDLFQIFDLISTSSDEVFSIIRENHFYDNDSLSDFVMYIYFYRVNDIDDFKNTIKTIFESLRNFDNKREIIINSIMRNNNDDLFDWFFEYLKKFKINNIASAISYPKVQFKQASINNKSIDNRNFFSFKKMFDFYINDIINQNVSEYQTNKEELILFDLIENIKTLSDSYLMPKPEIFDYVINYFSKKFKIKKEFSILYLYSKKIESYYFNLTTYRDKSLYRSDIMLRRKTLRLEEKFKNKIIKSINEKEPFELYDFLQSINIEKYDFINKLKIYSSLKEYVETNLEIKKSTPFKDKNKNKI